MISETCRIDHSLVRQAFARSADHYDQAAFLQREIGERLLQRLDTIKLAPHTIVDLGCGTGVATATLHKRFPQARILGLDLALPMLRKARQRTERLLCLCGNAEQLPLRSNTINLVYSNAMLQWCNNYLVVLQSLKSTLTSGGLLLFSTFGTTTLKELRWAWARVDSYSHVSNFPGVAQLKAGLDYAGFIDIMLDSEIFTPTYAKVLDLMADIKILGAHNATHGRARGLMGKNRLTTMINAYEQLRVDGRLPATYEVIYGLAWNP